MGDHPLLLKYGTAQQRLVECLGICGLDGFLERISRMYGSGGGMESVVYSNLSLGE